LEVDLSDEQRESLLRTDPSWWFTRFEFANAASPAHPKTARLEMANRMKQAMVLPWLDRLVPGKRVLDVFCANGGFSFESAVRGAAEVLGVDYDPPRIECARFIAELLDGRVAPLPRFQVGDVYELPAIVDGPFDVTLALGGLYHVGDPLLVLRNLRRVTEGHLILQTSRVLNLPGSWAKFVVVHRAVDRTEEGGAGVWKLSRKALETMLGHAGFEVLERLPVPRVGGRRIPWYGAVCRSA
jgi:tRNA (mo5U34)-methyltransferase